ncbi:hypothetical protein B5P43_23610 [Bacillus sp. SRB_336]|nr:hypothetical protein B5P43_23610 [Bacillus sp. SRB_336]
MITTAAQKGTSTVKASHNERRAVTGASAGFFIDMFDIYLPVIALAPAMAYFTPASLGDGTKAILAGLIFASTLIARPIGSIIFGWLGDSIGRKKATVTAVAGAGVATGLMALLPGYGTMGITAVILLIVLRFIGGIFLGGEYTGAVPLAMEHSARSNRGRNAGLIALGFPASYVVISGLTLLVLTFAPAGSPTSAYVQWGWRIAFAVGAVISISFAIAYARGIEESSAWKGARAKRANPLKELLSGPHRRPLAQAFLLMTGVWFSSNASIVVLPPTIGATTGLSAVQTSTLLIIAFVVVAIAYPLFGMLSQRIGRRAFFVLCGIGSFVAIPLFVTFAAGTIHSFWGATAIVTAVALCGIPAFGAIGAYMSERFPVSIRATGYGVGYSLALIIPSFYAFYMAGLSKFMPIHLTPTVLLAIGGACLILGALWGPETKNADMGAHPVATRDVP